MCFTIDQIDQACGLVLLNEFNTFIYCCKKCQSKFDSGPNLELHILSEHQNDNEHIENVFVNGTIFVGNFDGKLLDNSTEQHVENYPKTDVVSIELEPLDIKTEQSEQPEQLKQPEQKEILDEKVEQKKRKTSTKRKRKKGGKSKASAKRRKKQPIEKPEVPETCTSEEATKEYTSDTKEIGVAEQIDQSTEESNNDVFFDDFNNESDESVNDTKKRVTDRSFCCDMCPSVIKYKRNLVKHMRRHMEKKKQADKTSTKRKREKGDGVAEQIDQSIEESNHDVFFDDFNNESSDESVNDTKKRATDRSFCCDMCPSVLKYKGNLVQHLRRHMEKKKQAQVYHCDLCARVFTTRSGIYTHLRHHIKDRIRKTCPICNKTPMKYDKHMKMFHAGERPFKCNFCDKSYKANKLLIIHQRIHTGEAPFLCSSCGKTFTSYQSRRIHEKRMHGQQDHLCKDCGKSYITPSALLEHFYAVHSDDRPYKCEICDKSYSTKKYLRVHKLFHGEKKIQCRHCDSLFYTTPTRRFHEKTVHKIV